MGLLKKVLRPIYKRFFERPLWSFLSKVKVFLMADYMAEIEAKNAAQWRAQEQLLLAILRLPEQRFDTDIQSAPLRDVVNDRHNLR